MRCSKLYRVVLLIFLMTSCLSFGDTSELEKVVRDRPQLLSVIDRGSPIWVWLDQHFQNTNDQPAIWSSDLPNLPSHYLSAHHYNDRGQVVITVAGQRPDGTPIGGEEFLSMLVFELINGTHRDDFHRLDELAEKHKIDKASYEMEMAKIEHQSALAVKQFRVDYWAANSAEKHIPWDHPFWRQGTSESFEVYLRTIQAMREGYPDDVFGPRYDRLSQ